MEAVCPGWCPLVSQGAILVWLSGGGERRQWTWGGGF